jgi:hypothetical protein
MGIDIHLKQGVYLFLVLTAQIKVLKDFRPKTNPFPGDKHF